MVQEDTEVWKNVARSRHWVKKFSTQGGTVDVILQSGQRFEVTPSERRLNQEMCADPSLDLFANGTFQYVRLSADHEDNEAIESNPNHLSDDEMWKLLLGNTNSFKKRVEGIESQGAIERMIVLAEDAEEDDDESTSVSHRKVELLRERLSVISPSITHVRPSVEQGKVDTPPEDSQRFRAQRRS